MKRTIARACAVPPRPRPLVHSVPETKNVLTLTVFRHDWTAVLRYSSVVSFASLHQHDGGIEISFVGELVMRLSLTVRESALSPQTL